jgi:hypothetical protein
MQLDFLLQYIQNGGVNWRSFWESKAYFLVAKELFTLKKKRQRAIGGAFLADFPFLVGFFPNDDRFKIRCNFFLLVFAY